MSNYFDHLLRITSILFVYLLFTVLPLYCLDFVSNKHNKIIKRSYKLKRLMIPVQLISLILFHLPEILLVPVRLNVSVEIGLVRSEK